MVGTTAELRHDNTGLANSIGNMYQEWRRARSGWEDETQELRDYVFATDSSTTSNAVNTWANTTHIPKLTQIYDNLKANYMSALFPNDDWLEWLAGNKEAAQQAKRKTILAYMGNKLREDNFYTTISKCIDDYVLYGNVFAEAEFVSESKLDPVTGEQIPGYIGPRAVRISPYDMVFNPLAPRFVDSPKITRSIIELGEFKKQLETHPEDQGWLQAGVDMLDTLRAEAQTQSWEDNEKNLAIDIDGYGSYTEYLNSGYIEILELTGDIFDPDTGEFLKDRIVTIADRQHTLRNIQNNSWLSKAPMFHVGWRNRPDNLWAMSPLANIVGMQYRINHLENSKADAIDLNITPVFKEVGEVEDYVWGPGESVHVDENGDFDILSPDLTALNVDQDILFMMNLMEDFTGAPREAMGIRSPGEKTAFEVQSLVTAAGRIFQEKITNFEINLLEPLLNAMLEVAKRNVDGSDLIRVLDDDLGVVEFLKITKEDITAAGKLRPIGARHFASQAQLIQNLIGLANSAVWPLIQPHTSRIDLTKLVEDLLGLERFGLFGKNKGLLEDADSAQVANAATQELQQPTEEVADEQALE